MQLISKAVVLSMSLAVAWPTGAVALTFADNFSPPSVLWSNSTGDWTSSGGRYFALAPSNSPDTYSGLPFDFTNANLSITVTVNNLRDEDIWLDSDGTINNGVLLVLGGNAQAENWAYWHIDQNGSQSAPLDVNHNAFTPDLTYTVTAVIDGSTYKAYLDPDGIFDSNSVLLTTLVSNAFTHGEVGLYDFFPATSFSDFSVTGTVAPIPPSAALLATGLCLLGFLSRRPRRTLAGSDRTVRNRR